MDHVIQQKNAPASSVTATGASAKKTFAAIDPFAAWQRQEEENLIDSDPISDTDEASFDVNAVDETDEKSTDALPPPAEIKIFNETHHIEYRMIGGEIVPGIASTWAEVDEIFQELRRSNLLTDALRRGHSTVKAKNKDVNRLQKILDTLDGKLSNPRIRRTEEESKLRSERYKNARHKSLFQGQLDTAIRYFIQDAVAANSTIVAEILGASMPPIVHDTDVKNNTAANTYRYHTGTQADPIPLVWYKPSNLYQNINVTDRGTNTAITLAPNAQTNVTDSKGIQYTFGVNAANFALNNTWKNTPKHGNNRQTQKNLNLVLNDLGYDLSANSEDGDHVRDLGFGGADQIDNYWPLDSTVNRLAFNGWRSLYLINYKSKLLLNGNWKLEKAPLNSGSLVGKYFQITAENAVTTPQAGVASGSSTGWGAAGTVLADDNTPIVEG